MNSVTKQLSIEELEKILKTNPGDINALNNRAYLLTLSGRYDEAIGVCNAVIRLDSKNIRSLRTKSFVFSKLGQLVESAKIIEEILALDQKDLYALRNRAFYLNKSGNYAEAISVCDKILNLVPNDIRTLGMVVFALLRMETSHCGEAIIFCDKILAIDPKNINALKSRRFAIFKFTREIREAEKNDATFDPSMWTEDQQFYLEVDNSSIEYDMNDYELIQNKKESMYESQVLEIDIFEDEPNEDSEEPIGNTSIE